jgi:hypothetical protein
VASIIGVHGIGQQQSGRHQLLPAWRQATLDGLERASGRQRESLLSLDIAFYGDLFLPPARDDGSKGTGADGAEDEVTAEELGEFESAVTEALGADSVADPQENPSPKGFTQAPGPLRVLIRTVDRTLGAGAGGLLFGVFRQVKLYLGDAEVKRRVDDRVAAAVMDDTEIILGHSLGSVAAFEYVRSNPEKNISLITLGSPLGFKFTRKLLAGYSTPFLSRTVTGGSSWVNVRDLRDPVACAGDLRKWWPQSVDEQVHNGSDAHSATRYLGKAATGAAIISMLRDYGGDRSEFGRDDTTTLLRGRGDEPV